MYNSMFPSYHIISKKVHMCKISTDIYIYSLLIKKDICDLQNISVKPLRVYVCLSSGDLIFSAKVFSFFSYTFFVLSRDLFTGHW